MINNISRSFIAIILMLAMFGCEKPAKPANEEKPKYPGYEPVKQGTPIGDAYQQVIGPEGGMVKMPESEVSIEIPEGAVDQPTNISIQEVTNTLGKLGLGKSFKLLPEGVKFKKNVRITFEYDQETLDASDSKYLSLAYQDEEGYWHRMRNIEHMTGPRTIAVETKHFSSWTITTAFRIELTKDRLLKGETTQISVTVMQPPLENPENNESDLLAPYVSLRAQHIGGWSTVYGTLSDKNAISPIFTATDEVSKETSNLIELNLVDVYDPLEDKKTNVSLGYYFTLIPDQYIRFKYGDYIAWSNLSEVSTTSLISPEIIINGKSEIFSLQVNVYEAVTLNLFSAERKPGTSKVSFLAGREGFYRSYYFKCNDIKGYDQPGDVVFVQNDKTAGGYRIGLIKGKLTRENWCTPDKQIIPFEAEFRLKIPPSI